MISPHVSCFIAIIFLCFFFCYLILGVDPLDEKILQPLLQGSIAPQV
jgi:hypothetical protein